MSLQYSKFPMKYVNVTQVPDNSFSHKGSVSAWDNAGKDTGIDDAFAPFDAEIVWKDSGSAKTGVLIVNLNKVSTPKGIIEPRMIKLLLWHDNDISDLKVGQKLKQGEVFYQEGTAGHATGNHIHFNVGLGKYDGKYPLRKNEFGVWEIKDEIDPTKIFFLDDEHKIIKKNGMKWVTYVEEVLEEVKVNPNEPDWSKVDKGVWNDKTTLLLQKYYKTTADSVISGQVKNVCDRNIKGVHYGVGGSKLVKAMQKDLGLKQTGYINALFLRYLQRRLGTVVDGMLSTPSQMVVELQRRLLLGEKI